MYETKVTRQSVKLYKDGELQSEFADWQEMALSLLSEMDFLEKLYYDGDSPIFGDLALAKQAYPEMRFGQLIINALDAQRGSQIKCIEVFYATDEELTQGLRKLFQAKLIPFEEVKKKLYAEN